MLRDQLDCLRSIRLALIQCARYDTVPDAVLQSHDLEPGLARCLAKVEHGSDSHGPNLTQLCMATGLILYLSNRRIQSLPLTRLHSALLQQVREACLAAAPSHEACCYGVIAGLLMQASGSHQAALPLQRCLTAALTASIYGQVSCLTPAPPPIVMYSNSIVGCSGLLFHLLLKFCSSSSKYVHRVLKIACNHSRYSCSMLNSSRQSRPIGCRAMAMA